MAELHVERKERSLLPWLLAAIALLALLFWYFMGRGDDEGALATADTSSVLSDSAAGSMNAAGTAAGALGSFETFAREQPSAAAGHEYTADGLRRLADAISEVVSTSNTSMDVQQRVTEIRARADSLQRNPASNEHALQAREAALLAAGLIRDVRGDTATGTSGTTDVQQSAEAIDAQRPLLDQTTQVQQFFERSAAALRDLQGRSG